MYSDLLFIRKTLPPPLGQDSSIRIDYNLTNGFDRIHPFLVQVFSTYIVTISVLVTPTVFCPGFQMGRVPSEKGTLAR